MSSIDLKGRVVVVTGGSQGLGLEMAVGLAQAGARVVVASPDRPNLEKTVAEIGPDRAHAVVADISKADDCRRIFEETIKRFGDFEVLFNNARRSSPTSNRPVWEGDPEFWESAIRVNVFGTYLMTWTVLPYLMKKNWGRIVNITTSLDTIQRSRYSPYGVTKAAIEAETVIWAKDLAGTGVTVNSLIPGGACGTRDGRTKPPTRPGAVLLPPDIMVPAAIWLASDLSNGRTGGRYVGKLWDEALPPAEAAAKALEPSIFLPDSDAS